MEITQFIGGGYRNMLGKVSTIGKNDTKPCDRCGELFDPQWSNEDRVDRDVCERCYDIIGDEENLIGNLL